MKAIYALAAAFTLSHAAHAQTPSVSPGGIVNGASFASGAPVAPGSIVSVFGQNLATGTVPATSLPLPTRLGTTSVAINGIAAPLFVVSRAQINLQLPYGIGTASMVVTVGTQPSPATSFAVGATGPSSFVYGNNRAVALNSDGTLNSPANPANTGDYVSLYMTGQGALDNPVAAGAASPRSPLSRPAAPYSATIGGKASNVLFLGLAPDLVGVLQANLIVPDQPTSDVPVVVTIGGVASNGPLLAVRQTTSAGLAITRNFVHHEVTNFKKNFQVIGAWGQPVLSPNGNKIIYSTTDPNDTTPGTLRTYTMDFDGSNVKQIDALPGCNCGVYLDLSADGSRALITDGSQIRLIGSGGGLRVLTANRNVPEARLNSRGDLVYFLNKFGDASKDDQTTERGLYGATFASGGVRQIVGPTQAAALVGKTAADVYRFGVSGNEQALEASADGARIVFTVQINGYYVMGVNSDGSNLHVIAGPAAYATWATLSADGSKAGYEVVMPGGAIEFGTVNWDGSGRRVLLSGSVESTEGRRQHMTYDGSQLMRASTGKLFNTDGSGVLQVSIPSGSLEFDPPGLVYWGLYWNSMSSDARRFLYIVEDDAGNNQIATMEVNPLGTPTGTFITNPTLTPGYAVIGGSWPTLTANVSSTSPIRRVGASALWQGIYDDTIAQPVLYDDGTHGDATAKDGIYTHNRFDAGSQTKPGAHAARIKAESIDAGGKRHAFVVEFTPYQALTKAP